MKGFPRTTAFYAAFLLALTLSAVGCKSNQNANSSQATSQPSTADQSQAAPDQSEQAANQVQADTSDPANANIVPISNTTTGTSSATGSASGSGSSASGSAGSGSSGSASSGSSGSASGGSSASGSAGAASSDAGSAATANLSPAQYNEDNGYGQQPETYASQPPPELPQYQQPSCPGPGYIWTPGNWRWAQPAGYFWAPGAWVRAPYQGALWTPGYWGWRGGRYAYYRGYWGRHVGFYGGVNYGFGYVGFGYHGGYWRGNDFMYNRTVNNINVTVVRNVYEYKVVNITNTRVSFNGGNGGIRYRPRPVELVATVREQHNPPMQAQIQIRLNAEHDRQNFADVNHGRPAMVVVEHPVQADRNVRPPAVVNYREQPMHPMQPMAQQPDRGHPGRPMLQEHSGKQPQHQGQPQQPNQPQHPGQPRLQEHSGMAPQHPGQAHGPNRPAELHNQQGVPHQSTPQHQQPNRPGGPPHAEQNHPTQAHPQPGHPNDQKKNDHKKPGDQQPQ